MPTDNQASTDRGLCYLVLYRNLSMERALGIKTVTPTILSPRFLYSTISYSLVFHNTSFLFFRWCFEDSVTFVTPCI